MNVFYLRPLGLLPYRMYIQIGVLALLAVGVLANWRNWRLPFFRIASLAILMGYVILFSNSSEGHTYVIMLIGYQMWYWTMRRGGDPPRRPDRLLGDLRDRGRDAGRHTVPAEGDAALLRMAA